VIESLRYVLDRRPIGNLATLNHENILREVIRSGTKISLLVRVEQPSPRHYLIQRTYPGDPQVYDENGRLSRLKVFDLAPDLEIFGQHEIAEIANDRGKQLRLLHRYRNEPAARLEAGKVELAHQLEANRNELLRTRRDLQATEEQLARLPSLEEKLRSYQERGLEEKLREQSLLAREEQLIRFGRERVANLAKLIEQVRQRLEAEWQYAGEEETEKLPNVDLLKKIRQTQEALSRALSASMGRADRALEQARKDLLAVAQEWERRRQMRQQDYEQALRDLQKEGIDGTAFVKLRQEIEGLEPVRVQHARLVQRLNRLSKKRERLLQSWQDIRDQLFHLDAGAADRINRLLTGRVRLAMDQETGRELLIEKLKSFKLGFRGEVYERLGSHAGFTPAEFAGHLREGKDSLRQHYGLTERQARILASLEEALKSLCLLSAPRHEGGVQPSW